MKIIIKPMTLADREAVMNIFNHYVEHSFAAFPQSKLPYQAFDAFMKLSSGLPTGSVKNSDGELLGFGMLRPYNQMSVFSRTAEATCFIHPKHTGRGLGKLLLAYLVEGAMNKGINNILANISSLNQKSINFHRKNGFVECGRFIKVGVKHGKEFDTLWMQKILT